MDKPISAEDVRHGLARSLNKAITDYKEHLVELRKLERGGLAKGNVVDSPFAHQPAVDQPGGYADRPDIGKPQAGPGADHAPVMSPDKNRWERVVFAQGEDAHEPMQLLNEHGPEEAINYLSQWHQPGGHEYGDTPGHGTGDRTHEAHGYHLSWNPHIPYVGLAYDTHHEDGEEEGMGKAELAKTGDSYTRTAPLRAAALIAGIGAHAFATSGPNLPPNAHMLQGDQIAHVEHATPTPPVLRMPEDYDAGGAKDAFQMRPFGHLGPMPHYLGSFRGQMPSEMRKLPNVTTQPPVRDVRKEEMGASGGSIHGRFMKAWQKNAMEGYGPPAAISPQNGSDATPNMAMAEEDLGKGALATWGKRALVAGALAGGAAHSMQHMGETTQADAAAGHKFNTASRTVGDSIANSRAGQAINPTMKRELAGNRRKDLVSTKPVGVLPGDRKVKTVAADTKEGSGGTMRSAKKDLAKEELEKGAMQAIRRHANPLGMALRIATATMPVTGPSAALATPPLHAPAPPKEPKTPALSKKDDEPKAAKKGKKKESPQGGLPGIGAPAKEAAPPKKEAAPPKKEEPAPAPVKEEARPVESKSPEADPAPAKAAPKKRLSIPKPAPKVAARPVPDEIALSPMDGEAAPAHGEPPREIPLSPMPDQPVPARAAPPVMAPRKPASPAVMAALGDFKAAHAAREAKADAMRRPDPVDWDAVLHSARSAAPEGETRPFGGDYTRAGGTFHQKYKDRLATEAASMGLGHAAPESAGESVFGGMPSFTGKKARSIAERFADAWGAFRKGELSKAAPSMGAKPPGGNTTNGAPAGSPKVGGGMVKDEKDAKKVPTGAYETFPHGSRPAPEDPKKISTAPVKKAGDPTKPPGLGNAAALPKPASGLTAPPAKAVSPILDPFKGGAKKAAVAAPSAMPPALPPPMLHGKAPGAIDPMWSPHAHGGEPENPFGGTPEVKPKKLWSSGTMVR